MGRLLGGATQILSKSSSAFFFLNPNSNLSLYKPSKSPRLLASSAPSGSWPPPTRSSRAASTQLASPSSPSVAPRALNAKNLDETLDSNFEEASFFLKNFVFLFMWELLENADTDVKYKSYLDEWESDPNVKCVLVNAQNSYLNSFLSFLAILHFHFSMCLRDRLFVFDVRAVSCHVVYCFTSLFLFVLVFTAEYSLKCKISEYKKPYISFMDGITMGFGVGLSEIVNVVNYIAFLNFLCLNFVWIHFRGLFLLMPENVICLFRDGGFSSIAAKSPGGGSDFNTIGCTVCGSWDPFCPISKLGYLCQRIKLYIPPNRENYNNAAYETFNRWRDGELQVDSVMHVASIIRRTQCFHPDTGTLAPSPSDTWIYYKV
ncbi:hypothetical protein DVH24_017971 [Malus domestica]|uniref:3-hydroxyisobutyryl-CoA hydrolase n=1 Tax=Malus domestica TaxID=3750 RepID=A0A498KCN2_MALDO|nr:hypothetical protein DVH24_017971 [Malus domestica]